MYKSVICFSLQKNYNIDIEGDSVDIPIDGSLILLTKGNSPIKKSNQLILISSGFITEEEARIFGLRMKNSLIWCSTKMRVGLDSELFVYDESSEQSFLNSKTNLAEYIGGEALIVTLKEGYELNLILDDKQTLASELYAMSHFEASSRARFITLVICIETLLKDQPESNEAVVNHVDKLIKMTKDSGLPDTGSLMSSLGILKNKSITQRAMEFVRMILNKNRYNEKEAAQFFKDCYKIRGNLVHNGRAPADLDLLMKELDRLVSDILVKYLPPKV